MGPPGYQPPLRSPKCNFQFVLTPPPLDMFISRPMSISQTPQLLLKHIIIVPRGVVFRDSTLGTLMIREILIQRRS